MVRAVRPICAVVGRSQVVRQRILIPPFPGSNPGVPAKDMLIDQLFRGKNFSHLDSQCFGLPKDTFNEVHYGKESRIGPLPSL